MSTLREEVNSKNSFSGAPLRLPGGKPLPGVEKRGRDSTISVKQNFEFEPKTAASYRRAYDSGKKAKTRGWSRVSPYYRDGWADWWFYAGYDGMGQDEAWEAFREEHKRGMFELCPALKEIYG